MRIVCFGDSNTWGYDPRSFFGDRYDAPWPSLLTGLDVINAGQNGREIPRNGNILPGDADMVLVMLGTNDLLQGASAEEAAARMERFLTGHKNVILIAPPPMKRGAWVPTEELVTESIRLGDLYEDLARRLGIPFIDSRPWNIGLAFDGVHFTEAGHRKFAEKLQKVLDSPPASWFILISDGRECHENRNRSQPPHRCECAHTPPL